MKETLKPGVRHELSFEVTAAKTVGALYPEAPAFGMMPNVFASGFMIGFLEWACIDALQPHLDWPAEQTVGTNFEIAHEAATPPGLTVIAKVELIAVEGKKLTFQVEAHDGIDRIASGRHERFVIDKEKFDARLVKKIP